MRRINPAIYRPPGDPEGFNASEDLLNSAAKLLVIEYAMPQNLKKGSIGQLVVSNKEPNRKRWNRNLSVLNDHMIAAEMTRGKRCFGVAHNTFSNLFSLDVDNPETGDADLIASGLRGRGWAYKSFNSGRGIHFWIFFQNIPRELLRKYRNGPAVMKLVAESFLDGFSDWVQGRIDIRGCDGNLIKLPLQYDPYHQKIVLPLDGEGEMIADFEKAVAFAADITRNDPGSLIEFLEDFGEPGNHENHRVRKERESTDAHCPVRTETGDDFQEWLNNVCVRPGESNDFMYRFVHRCWKYGLSQEETIATAKDLYEKGHADGRVTCKDTWPEWRSKVLGQVRKCWQIKGERKGKTSAKFHQGDLAWIRKHAIAPSDPLFLAIHLWAARLSGSNQYYMSRPTATRWGITDKRYRNAVDRFIKRGLLEITAAGRRAPVKRKRKGQATRFKLTDYPERSGPELAATNPSEVVSEYADYLRNTRSIGSKEY